MPRLLVKWMQCCVTWRCDTKICAIAVEIKPRHHALPLIWRSQLRQAVGSLIIGLMDRSHPTLQFEPKSVTLVSRH
jgi:hypothetical protein